MEMRLAPFLTQFRTENRFALFLELPLFLTQFRTKNRFALFLELLVRHPGFRPRTLPKCKLM